MRVTTIDPISGNEVDNPDMAPSVVEGHGKDALTIHFESDENQQTYLAIESKTPQQPFTDICNDITGHAQEIHRRAEPQTSGPEFNRKEENSEKRVSLM